MDLPPEVQKLIDQQGPGRTEVQVIHGGGKGGGQPQQMMQQPMMPPPAKQPKADYSLKPNIVLYPVPVQAPPPRPPPRPVVMMPPPPPRLPPPPPRPIVVPVPVYKAIPVEMDPPGSGFMPPDQGWRDEPVFDPGPGPMHGPPDMYGLPEMYGPPGMYGHGPPILDGPDFRHGFGGGPSPRALMNGYY